MNTKHLPGKRLKAGAIGAEKLAAPFPKMALPVAPPFPPAEAKAVREIPQGREWIYEPKWDGFRCLAFRSKGQVVLQSKSGQPLGRYFPELVEALKTITATSFVLDGEIIVEIDGHLSFDALLQRIHPAESRIRKLAQLTPGTFLVFDLLVDGQGSPLVQKPFSLRRSALARFAGKLIKIPQVRLSPQSTRISSAQDWMRNTSNIGFDGVMAKRIDLPYMSGERTGMIKIKRLRTADCVVGGFRYGRKGRSVGSLLLGLYNHAGQLDHVGFTASFKTEDRKELKRILKSYRGEGGFSGKAPGGPSRWSTDRSGQWESLKPKLVCEVQYDHFSGGRFRHGTKFIRWRPDKAPRQCTIDQVKQIIPKAA